MIDSYDEPRAALSPLTEGRELKCVGATRHRPDDGVAPHGGAGIEIGTAMVQQTSARSPLAEVRELKYVSHPFYVFYFAVAPRGGA